MAEEQEARQTAISEIIRPELSERGLSDPLEFLYLHMPEFSDSERINLLSYSLEAEGQAFEVQCCLCAQYAGHKDKQLKDFIERYNRQAKEQGSKVVSYQYARQMSRVGRKMLDEGLRMTADFPALSPSYYVAALDAADFAGALRRAQAAVTEYQARPQEVRKYTVRAFKDEIHTGKPRRLPTTRTQTQEAPKKGPVVSPSLTIEEEKSVAKPVGATCYDCRHCWQPNDHQRLAVVNTKGSAAIDLMLEPTAVWICRKRKAVISVRTQVYARAEALARSCSAYEPVEEKPEVIEPSGERVEPQDEPIISLHNEELDPAGPPLSSEELDQYLEVS